MSRFNSILDVIPQTEENSIEMTYTESTDSGISFYDQYPYFGKKTISFNAYSTEKARDERFIQLNARVNETLGGIEKCIHDIADGEITKTCKNFEIIFQRDYVLSHDGTDYEATILVIPAIDSPNPYPADYSTSVMLNSNQKSDENDPVYICVSDFLKKRPEIVDQGDAIHRRLYGSNWRKVATALCQFPEGMDYQNISEECNMSLQQVKRSIRYINDNFSDTQLMGMIEKNLVRH